MSQSTATRSAARPGVANESLIYISDAPPGGQDPRSGSWNESKWFIKCTNGSVMMEKMKI